MLRHMALRRSHMYYGWYIALTLALVECFGWGIMYFGFSVFLAPMEAELGWSRSTLTGGFSMLLLVMGIMAYPVGSWVDRHGARMLMALGSACAGVLVIAWGFVTSPIAYYIVWIGLGICGSAILYEPAFAVVAQWFRKGRSTALTVITFAGGLSSTLFLPLMDALLQRYGWRLSVVLLGMLIFIVLFPITALVIRRRPADLGLLPDGESSTAENVQMVLTGMTLREVLRTRGFWLLALAFGLSSLSASAIRVHFIPYLTLVGVDSSAAAIATGIIGVTQVIGRLVFAPIERRVRIYMLVLVVFGVQAVSALALVLGSNLLTIGIFILCFGISQGTFTLVRASMMADLYGIRHYGRISSVMAIVLTVTATSAPVVASLIYDNSGSYDLVLWLVLFLAIGATVVIYWAKRDTSTPHPEVLPSKPVTQ